MKDILNQWTTLRDNHSTMTLYSFVDVFETIVKPYYNHALLKPFDRMEIEMVLTETLECECDITKECDDDNINVFCHVIVFKILEANRKTPKNIEKIIHQLNTSK